MSRIKNLINELCPNGVKYIKLDDLLNYIQPAKYIVKSTDYNDNYKTPVLTAGQTFILGYTNEEAGIFNASKDKPVIIFDDFMATNHWVDFDFKVKSSAMKILVPKTNNILKYIYYCINNINYTPKEHSRQWIQNYSQFKIPLPPIEIQKQIVSTLDKFGELEAELKAELEERKSQYEFWRGQFFKHKGNLKISDLFTRVKGTPITAGKMKEIENTNGKIRIFAGGQTAVNANLENIPNANIIDYPCVIVQSRGLIDFIYYDKPFTFKNEMWAYTCDNKIMVKYLYYYLKNNVNYFRKLGTQMGSMPQISLPVTEKFEIFLPSLEEQEKVVKILDKFDRLINDITVGIPAEIELRKQQYEYYRNKLLSFKEIQN